MHLYLNYKGNILETENLFHIDYSYVHFYRAILPGRNDQGYLSVPQAPQGKIYIFFFCLCNRNITHWPCSIIVFVILLHTLHW